MHSRVALQRVRVATATASGKMPPARHGMERHQYAPANLGTRPADIEIAPVLITIRQACQRTASVLGNQNGDGTLATTDANTHIGHDSQHDKRLDVQFHDPITSFYHQQ